MPDSNVPNAMLFTPRLSREPRPIGKLTIIGGLVIAAAVAAFYGTALLHMILYRAYSIPSAAMEPTIDNGDRIFVDTRYYQSHPIMDGDLVVFHHKGYTVVKRVSAIAGETIGAADGVLYRNGVQLQEPYVRHAPQQLDNIETFTSRTVPAGQIFVTGDSRDQSLDSRSEEYGPVLVSDVLGRVKSVYFSTHPGQTGRKFF